MIELTRRRLMALGLTTALVSALGLPAFAQEEALPAVPELVLGSADAKVTITEYASYTCPHCATFHTAVFKPLKAEYIDTGKVRFIYREVYFDRYGLWGAMLARCGGDMRYFGISGILFEKQQEWAASDDPGVVIENLKAIGRSAGLSNEQLDACYADQKMAEAMVADFQKNMEADDVQGTPTLFINGTKHSNMAYADLKALIDAELAK
ncbi:MAG: thiol-disulfide oxidoreductase [Rhodobacteraceae bacterium GWE1_64_9]|nr:MAG: thiol-disulfide oxidoreductase [Rhodobacteraceae bacterium GWE1_64_9]OHC47172.1 MAG: thiol-disulfide oxidoreductase [Rhodobacteraceae bacterium GWF1_65_7]HBD89175.1 thiol-disulfide oxidoreductase [Gemmobacter sp.]HBU13691.1 thiol-disulfide oxidoreductase [Gemmobacter sp.]